MVWKVSVAGTYLIDRVVVVPALREILSDLGELREGLVVDVDARSGEVVDRPDADRWSYFSLRLHQLMYQLLISIGVATASYLGRHLSANPGLAEVGQVGEALNLQGLLL